MKRREFLKLLISSAILPTLLYAREKKNMIVYYSRTLNTHILALYISELFKAELFCLECVQSYPKDYEEMVALARWQKEQNIMPQLRALPSLEGYENIFLGTPLWGLSLSAPMKSFLSKCDLRGKNLIPFVANAGWGLGNAVNEISTLQKGARIYTAFACEFKLKEKDEPNLRALNTELIASNQAFNTLEKDKIKLWLKSMKI